MAYLEVGIVIAKMFWYFDFERAPGKAGELGGGTGSDGGKNARERKGEYQLYDAFAADHHGPNLVFRARPLPKDSTLDLRVAAEALQ
jgi:hypothetical protein